MENKVNIISFIIYWIAKFYLTLSSALRGYIADKLNISEAGFLTDDVREMLAKKQVDEKVSDIFIELLNSCDYLRFAPSGSNLKDMENIYKESKETIIKFENYFK